MPKNIFTAQVTQEELSTLLNLVNRVNELAIRYRDRLHAGAGVELGALYATADGDDTPHTPISGSSQCGLEFGPVEDFAERSAEPTAPHAEIVEPEPATPELLQTFVKVRDSFNEQIARVAAELGVTA